MATRSEKVATSNIGVTLKELRERNAWSQGALAKQIGVSRISIARWESGRAYPSLLAEQNIRDLLRDSPDVSQEVLRGKKVAHPKRGSLVFRYGTTTKQITPAPYVVNGPRDQNKFHIRLIKMQEPKLTSKLSWDSLKSRLSLVDTADGHLTSQAKLEDVSTASKSWNSNYGPHGWHRYVGRFPPHLVRSLLNRFGAGPDDVVCDPFVGSGTTLVEARLLGIPAIGIEICPLSTMISRAKSHFTSSTVAVREMAREFEQFYQTEWHRFVEERQGKITHESVVSRPGNNIPDFVNAARWFTPTALLGVSLTTQYATKKNGYLRDLLLTALSSKMRSIGNVDVDVIRAEYSKKPRADVDVLRLVKTKLLKMSDDIDKTITTHSESLLPKSTITIKQGSALDTVIPPSSISCIITSPPYGVESLSYLRTHLLSYRTLGLFLKTDPYEFGSRVIGSEYLPKKALEPSDMLVAKASPAYRKFFEASFSPSQTKEKKIRLTMMMKFFEDMDSLASRFHSWLRPGGQIAFVIGNKRIDEQLIPTDDIIREIFSSKGLELRDVIAHKLKTNNSNSKVPWQDRIIDQEFIMIFEKL